MEMLQKMLFILVVLCLKVVFASTTIGAGNHCTPEISNYISQDITSKYSYACSNIDSTVELMKELPSDAAALTIFNSNFTGIGMDYTEKKFKSLQTITVIRSYVGPIVEWFHTLDNLHSLIFINSSTSFIIAHDDTNVTVIDLKLNSFKNLQHLTVTGGNITQLDRSGVLSLPDLLLSNNRFECGQDFIWLLEAYEKQDVKVTLNNTLCFMKKIDVKVSHPMIYTMKGKPLIPVMEYKREAIVNCPPKCICELKGLLTVDRPQLNIDCINLNMTKLPDVIPNGSSRCNFSYNSISDLSPLYTNSIYEKVTMMVLTHNNISYLDPVKFPELLRNRKDVGFCLDHNQIRKFPAEALKNVFEEAQKNNRYMPQFFLGYNPWICSCDYIGHFQDLIYQNMYDIFDSQKIRCADDDPYNPGVMVLGLNVNNLCSKEPLFNTLDLLNLMLALLLIILIADFMYNYYHYKKHQKLPWIVTKFKC